MSRRSRSPGFTLVELGIIVAIVGILSLLAIVAYKRWIRTSYMAEAQDMLQGIRAAEETFKSESGGYLAVSKTLDVGFTYPAQTPGAFKSAWGSPCPAAACVSTTSWTTLAVEPKGPVAFGYAVVADNSGAAPSSAVSAATSKMQASVDLTNLGALGGGTRGPWFVVEALGDINGDGVFTRVLGNSDTNQVIVDREGE